MLFKRSPKLHYCRNLISANPDGNIIFAKYGLPHKVEDLIRTIIRDNRLYLFGDKAYAAVYNEYKAHYQMYDQYPWLLYFRIPIVISAQYASIQFIESRVYYLSSDKLDALIPEFLRIPKPNKDLILECLHRCTPYMANWDGEGVDSYGDFLEFKFLSEWPAYLEDPKVYIDNFNGMILGKMIYLGGDLSKTVQNVIERTIDEKLKEATSN